MADDSEAPAAPSDGVPPAAPVRPAETREEMLERHRAEAKDLVKKDMAMKKAAAKGSKAEQKAKKKAVDEKILALETEMKARHKRELDALAAASAAGAAAASLAGLAISGDAGGRAGGDGDGEGAGEEGAGGGQAGRVTRAQKRREKKSRQEAERAARIEEEQEGLVSERAVEDGRLAAKLSPLGLTVREVKPDGHCLFRAVEDQLRGGRVSVDGSAGGALGAGLGAAGGVGGGAGGEVDFWGLRAAAAGYMRSHADDFLPFVVAELASGDLQPYGDGRAGAAGGGAAAGGADGSIPAGVAEWEGEPEERRMFLRYCHEVEHTAAWGGQLELQALAQSLRRHIVVHSADLPDVNLGLEYAPAGADAAAAGVGGGGGGAAAAAGAGEAGGKVAGGGGGVGAGAAEAGVAKGSGSIRVSYHRHAYGLGEHYNSVVPLAVPVGGGGLLGDASEEECVSE